MTDSRDVRYATASGGIQVAYEIFGDGPTDVVWVNGMASNLDLNGESPVFQEFHRRQPRFARVLSFDKRGSGLSERSLGAGTLEDRMDDIRAVMDAAGWERAALQAAADGGPIALAFAATYPERVTALVLQGSWARLGRAPGYDIGIAPDVADAFLELVLAAWGSGDVLAALSGLVDVKPSDREMLARIERSQGPPRSVADLIRLDLQMDARDALPLVSAPTLVVIPATSDVVPEALWRYVADAVPGARSVTVDSAWGAGDAVDAVQEFLTGIPADAVRDADRVLATCLFTDIVDSTKRAASLGDAAWRELLDRHDRTLRQELARYSGTEVATAGDGFFATFDGPGRAMRCARSMCGAVQEIGLAIRAGIHTGEVTRRADNYSGMAVHIAARVAALAQPSEVLVTRTVRDLVVGSDLAFVDRGAHSLKGVDGTWELFAMA